MPNKYEREIEEILRNMDRADQSQTLGDRIRAFNRPSPKTRLRGPRMRLRLSSSESLLLVGLMLALVGAGIAYYLGGPISGTSAYLGGLIGVTAFVCVLTGLIVGWRARFGHRSPAMWRGQTVTPPRRLHPLSAIGTQLRIMRLKWRYWRSRGK
ncbi:MAG TPA: hypothetical protein VF916_04805 [Ktedonobacterales bacterium]